MTRNRSGQVSHDSKNAHSLGSFNVFRSFKPSWAARDTEAEGATSEMGGSRPGSWTGHSWRGEMTAFGGKNEVSPGSGIGMKTKEWAKIATEQVLGIQAKLMVLIAWIEC